MKTNLKTLIVFILFCFATPITLLAQGSGDCTNAPSMYSWTSAPCITRTIHFGAPYNKDCEVEICYCYHQNGLVYDIFISSITFTDEDCATGISGADVIDAVMTKLYTEIINVVGLYPCSEYKFAIGEAFFTACVNKVRVPYWDPLSSTWRYHLMWLPCGTGYCVHSYKFCKNGNQIVIIPNGIFTTGTEECTGECVPMCQ